MVYFAHLAYLLYFVYLAYVGYLVYLAEFAYLAYLPSLARPLLFSHAVRSAIPMTCSPDARVRGSPLSPPPSAAQGAPQFSPLPPRPPGAEELISTQATAGAERDDQNS